MKDVNPLFLIDFYKADHRSQYPKATEFIYSNFTPRKSRIPEIQYFVTFGIQYLLQEYLVERFNNWFARPLNDVLSEYKQRMDECLFPDAVSIDHIKALHELQYLPIEIKALPEGSISPIQTPILTIINTKPEFFWLTNYLETLISVLIWKPCTNATVATHFRKTFNEYARTTGASLEFCEFQGHDFSFRGLSCVEDACLTGAAHLLSFKGTDTVPALDFIHKYYQGTGFIGGSVPATEHSVQCVADEKKTIVRLLTEIYPKGICSIVSDTYDFWSLVGEFYPSIKDLILARDGKLVIRPDTGIPHKIINGDPTATTEIEKMGLIRSLANNFGYTVNAKGFKVLNPKIGAIYGDSIDIKEQKLILEGLKNNGFSTDCVVLGIGSYTYQYCTRDTFGLACKATWAQIDGRPKNIFKNPKTGTWKKSHKGLLKVNNDYSTSQECSQEEEQSGLLRTVFKNSKIQNQENWNVIRNRLQTNIDMAI